MNPYEFDEQSLSTVIKNLETLSKDMIDPIYVFDGWESFICGIKPMSDKEIAAANRKSEIAKKAAVTKKQKAKQKDLELLKKLIQKYPEESISI